MTSLWPLNPPLQDFVCRLFAAMCTGRSCSSNGLRLHAHKRARYRPDPSSLDVLLGIPSGFSTYASPCLSPGLLGSASPLAAPHATSADPSRGAVSWVTRLQNGVVRVCAERAAVSRRPVLLRPERLPGAGRRVFPEPALLSRRPRSPR